MEKGVFKQKKSLFVSLGFIDRVGLKQPTELEDVWIVKALRSLEMAVLSETRGPEGKILLKITFF